MKESVLVRHIRARYVVSLTLFLGACGAGTPAALSSATPVALSACGSTPVTGVTLHCPPGTAIPASSASASSSASVTTSTLSATNKASQ